MRRSHPFSKSRLTNPFFLLIAWVAGCGVGLLVWGVVQYPDETVAFVKLTVVIGIVPLVVGIVLLNAAQYFIQQISEWVTDNEYR